MRLIAEKNHVLHFIKREYHGLYKMLVAELVDHVESREAVAR